MQPIVDITHERVCNNQKMVITQKDAERGKRISEAIEQSPLSKADIARKLQVSPQAVSKWCKTGKIARAKLLELAAYTHTDASYIDNGSAALERKPIAGTTVSSNKLYAAFSFLIREHGPEVLEIPLDQLSELLANEYNSLPD